ncbi:MAG TPA: hypothetical protein VGO03_01885 [Acidimicrobiia bacterium]|jgi:hypothetical protein
MDQTDEQPPRPKGPVERPADDPTDLVARLRARLAEHEPEPRRRFDLAGRARDALARLRPNFTGRLTGRRRIELLAGVVAVAIAVVGAIFVLGGVGSPTPQPTAVATTLATARSATTHAPTTTTPHNVAVLLTLLPEAWRRTCHHVSDAAAPQPRAALICAPAAGIRVGVRRVPAGSTAGAVARLATGGPPAPGGAACARDEHGLRTWSAPVHPETVLGSVVCVRSRGQARLVWSVDHGALVLDATRSDGDIASLFAWWVASTF